MRNVIDVEVLDDYKILVSFSNSDNQELKQGIFDVKPYIFGEWFGKLEDKAYFKTVRPVGRTVEWAGGQDIAPHELYELADFSANIDVNTKELESI